MLFPPACTLSSLLALDGLNTPLRTLATAPAQARGYGPFGEHGPTAHGTRHSAFTGQWREPYGHYLLGNGYRAYSPRLLRFHSPDNLSPFDAGGLNAYAYCAAEPVNRDDPSGHAFFSSPRVGAVARPLRLTHISRLQPRAVNPFASVEAFAAPGAIPRVHRLQQLARTAAPVIPGGAIAPGPVGGKIARASERVMPGLIIGRFRKPTLTMPVPGPANVTRPSQPLYVSHAPISPVLPAADLSRPFRKRTQVAPPQRQPKPAVLRAKHRADQKKNLANALARLRANCAP